MKRSIILGLFFVAGSAVTAAPQKPAETFARQLDCAIQKALAASKRGTPEAYKVRKSVDKCMSITLSSERAVVRAPASGSLVALEARRESLVEAVLQRIQLCRDTGIAMDKFATACPQLFTIERLARD